MLAIFDWNENYVGDIIFYSASNPNNSWLNWFSSAANPYSKFFRSSDSTEVQFNQNFGLLGRVLNITSTKVSLAYESANHHGGTNPPSGGGFPIWGPCGQTGWLRMFCWSGGYYCDYFQGVKVEQCGLEYSVTGHKAYFGFKRAFKVASKIEIYTLD